MKEKYRIIKRTARNDEQYYFVQRKPWWSPFWFDITYCGPTTNGVFGVWGCRDIHAAHNILDRWKFNKFTSSVVTVYLEE